MGYKPIKTNKSFMKLEDIAANISFEGLIIGIVKKLIAVAHVITMKTLSGGVLKKKPIINYKKPYVNN